MAHDTYVFLKRIIYDGIKAVSLCNFISLVITANRCGDITTRSKRVLEKIKYLHDAVLERAFDAITLSISQREDRDATAVDVAHAARAIPRGRIR